jgi:hypothetical protein
MSTSRLSEDGTHGGDDDGHMIKCSILRKEEREK